MAAAKVAVGWGVLLVGLLLGAYGVAYPSSASSSQSYSVLPSAAYDVDGNGYHSTATHLAAGQIVSAAVSVNVTTIFDFVIMNTTQYRNFYNCAPLCRSPFANGTGIKPAFLVNQTVTPATPYNQTFTAPKADNYYFVFDNTVGTNKSQYLACGNTGTCNGPPAKVTFALGASRPVTTYSTNWLFVGSGAALLIVGGGLATAMMGGRKMKPEVGKPMT